MEVKKHNAAHILKKEYRYEVDFFNLVAYKLDNVTGKRLTRWTFDSRIGVLAFLMRRQKIRYNKYFFKREDFKEKVPVGYMDAETLAKKMIVKKVSLLSNMYQYPERFLKVRIGKYAFYKLNPDYVPKPQYLGHAEHLMKWHAEQRIIKEERKRRAEEEAIRIRSEESSGSPERIEPVIEIPENTNPGEPDGDRGPQRN